MIFVRLVERRIEKGIKVEQDVLEEYFFLNSFVVGVQIRESEQYDKS